MTLTETWRISLYPLGILASIAFALRFGIQWLQSERAGRTTLTPLFWWLSMFGNITLAFHSFIQGQYPICVVQTINGVIALRNLNFMQTSDKQWALRSVLLMLLTAVITPTLLFWIYSPAAWARIPTHFFQPETYSVSLIWHMMGTLGILLHSSRFWIQWIHAEKTHTSSLELPFWWLSLAGALLSLAYFGYIRDYINLIGPLVGLVPYCRNLILAKRAYVKS